MLLPHHFNCFLGAIEIEFVVLFSFLRMLLTQLILSSIGLPFCVNSAIKSLIGVEAGTIILRLAIILHAGKEKLVANWRIEIC